MLLASTTAKSVSSYSSTNSRRSVVSAVLGMLLVFAMNGAQAQSCEGRMCFRQRSCTRRCGGDEWVCERRQRFRLMGRCTATDRPTTGSTTPSAAPSPAPSSAPSCEDTVITVVEHGNVAYADWYLNENGQELFSERTSAHETETYEGCLNLTSDCYEFSIIGYAGYGTTQANWTIDFETSTDLSGTISGNETDTETFGACSGRKLETTTSIRRPKKLHYTIDEEGGMVDLTVLSPNDEQTDIKIEIASIESGIIVEELYRGPVSVNKPIIVSFDAGNIYVATYKAIITNMASPDDAKELVLFRELPQ